MTSLFGWLATDPRQRRTMLEAIDQFKDETTVDDLGLGVIRDAISDTLFPGTSTLHTRIRYALFIPWQLQLAAETHDNVIDMRRAFHDSEYQLIDALSDGGETVGVIGRVAGTTLQRTPSSVYWGMLTRWGIFQPGFTVEDFFDRHLQRQAQRNAVHADDPEWRPEYIDTGLHPKLPAPPADILDETTFTLREEDEDFLRHAITYRASNTLLAHLVEHKPSTWIDAEHAPRSFAAADILTQLPADLYATVITVNKFAVGIHGANLMYNYILAKHTQRVDRDELLEDRYAHLIADWFADITEAGIPTQHDLHEIWRIVTATNRRLGRSTTSFIEVWFDHLRAATTPEAILDSTQIARHITQREQQKKGARARLKPGNHQALDAWSGAAGTARYTFRWEYVVQHLNDLYTARGAF